MQLFSQTILDANDILTCGERVHDAKKVWELLSLSTENCTTLLHIM